ncbi:hypothetical protein SGRIM119S_02985 [Streptomyces griseorubiginosus]
MRGSGASPRAASEVFSGPRLTRQPQPCAAARSVNLPGERSWRRRIGPPPGTDRRRRDEHPGIRVTRRLRVRWRPGDSRLEEIGGHGGIGASEVLTDVLRAGEILSGLAAVTGHHECHLLAAPALDKACCRACHDEARAQDHGAFATASAPTVPAVVFCTTVRPVRSSDLMRPGEFTVAKPGAGAPSFTASHCGWLSFKASASVSDAASTIFSAPREKAQAVTVKARITSTTTATRGTSVSSGMPTKRWSISSFSTRPFGWGLGSRRWSGRCAPGRPWGVPAADGVTFSQEAAGRARRAARGVSAAACSRPTRLVGSALAYGRASR